MDKYEYNIKSDKIKKLVERKDYETAVKIADTIDWERVRNIKMLSTVSLAYEKVSRFEEAKDLLLMAYECAPVGRRFLYKLTELATKQGEFDEAEAYLKEFAATSPQDPSRLLLRYEISRAKGEPTERLITILEAYQKREFEERWSYELANLYYRVGKNEECVKLCDEIVLWFGVGTYVDKAMELKQRIAPLTPDQIEKRENKEKYLRRLEEVQKEFEDRYRVIEEPTKEAVEAAVTQVEQESETVVEQNLVEEEVIELTTEEEAPAEESPEEEVTVEMASRDDIDQETLDEEDLDEETLKEESLEEEVETSLAREIETATLTAALNEVMLRETAATMESMEVGENDHSQEQERTRVAVVRVSMQDKTREFVREARVINVVLEEASGREVTVEEVEARLLEESEKESVEEAIEEAILVEEPEEAPAEEVIEEETPVEEPEEEPAEEVIEEEAPVEEPEEEPAEEVIEEETPVEESVEEPAEEVIEEEAPVEEPEEAPAEEVIEEETPVEEPEEELAEEVVEEEITTETSKVRDHYVLVICSDEGEGVKECVAYIRRMRELLGYPVTQVAKIQGSKLATKDMAQTLRKLQGRDLVVVGISGLPDVLLCQTIDLMAQDTIESFIALVGTEEEIAELQSRQAFFAGCRVIACGVELLVQEIPVEVSDKMPEEQTNQELSLEEEQSMLAKLVEEALHANLFAMEEQMQEDAPEEEVSESVEAGEEVSVTQEEEGAVRQIVQEDAVEKELTPKAFYECAVQYANMMDAKVDEMGGLAIYAAAEEFQQEREPLTEELAQELVEKAIQKAERRTLKSLFSNRYDKEGFLILKEQHFKD